jgi:serine/threonine protein kinase
LEHGIDNQASFFAFALQLRVPVQSYVANHGCNISLRALGQGASYNVTQTVIGLETDVSSGIGAFVNEESIRKPSHMGIKNENGYVVKSIHTGEPTSDRERLAAISNEIRILSTKTIAERNVCVGLFCVAWDEHPDATGRYWPRVMLPRADHGNLNDYLCSISIQTFEFYLSILSDIAKALEVLHSHGIVHGDVKMENVLVFAQNNMEIKGRVTAKLGDFGFSIIPSDRQETSKFCCTEWGTRPWQAPELTLGEQVLPELLFRVDIYSFGLFCSCVHTHRLRPPDEEIEEHKKYSDPAMAKFVEDFILSHSEFSVVQKRQIRFLLDTTLRRHGTDRIGASALAAHIRYMQESSEFPEGSVLPK